MRDSGTSGSRSPRLVSERDEFIYHEMVSHPVLFSHADPRRVVIVGGGDCGTLREVLRADPGYVSWMVEKGAFSAEVVKLCREAMDGRFPVKK